MSLLKQCLHCNGKARDPNCVCGHPSQHEEHLVFHCTHTSTSRDHLLPQLINTWKELDDPHWITEARGEENEQKKIEGTKAFFQDLHWELKKRIGEQGANVD